MNDESDARMVLEVTDALEELTRHHTELLHCVRSLHDELHRSPMAVSPEPPAPRLMQPPPPRRGMSPLPPPQPIPPLAGGDDFGAPPPGTSHAVDQAGTPQSLTKRHYDFFAELDDLLARLPVTPAFDQHKAPFDH